MKTLTALWFAVTVLHLALFTAILMPMLSIFGGIAWAFVALTALSAPFLLADKIGRRGP